ncbi:hypothetical protein [Roseimaritima ulvae]|uniref:DUF883 domain-containing protein n=1 Tax=Roseimaritima ulvae TaxID=980254 RepID=A0A5B9R563_9BACT|nr:hypothetical protein [Roseimaritima ulvae]QEG41611.1 hypothetical protein UC8_36360 [Roseimaritima ulvae]
MSETSFGTTVSSGHRHDQGTSTGTDQARQKANEAVESAKDKAAEAQEQLKRKASEATEAAKQKATEAAETAKQSGRKYAHEKKARLADEIGVFSGAIRKASSKLHDEEHDSIASYVDAAAEQLDHLRESLQSKDVGDLLADVQDFTRRRPEVVYGGLFVVGLAAMRFLKASKPSESRQTRQADLSQDRNRPPEAFGHDPTAGTTRPPVGYRNQGTLNPEGSPKS